MLARRQSYDLALHRLIHSVVVSASGGRVVIWRLVEIGEVIQEGDEWLVDGEWKRVTAFFGTKLICQMKLRRRIGWIPINDRKPEFPCVMVDFSGGATQYAVCWQPRTLGPSTHWCPLPEPPQSDDDVKWRKWESEARSYTAKDCYFAGLAEGRKR